jgi:DNA helicase-2/ATP-dependent DNA helicase PcrA
MPLEEERRLFYVGITRAEKLLYITHAGMRMTYGRYQPSAPSRFIESLPEQHVRNLGSRRVSVGSTRPTLMDRARESARRAAEPTPITASATVIPAKRTFSVGERVFHPKFGEGSVVEAISRRDDQELAIEFVRHGRKRLLASLAQLDVIE